MTESPLKNLDKNELAHVPDDPNVALPCRTRTYILLMNLSLLTGLPFFPVAFLGVSVHISFTFSKTMLQCLSNAFTLARSFLLFRHEIRTCVCDRTAVWRIERGPEVNSCSSSWAISNSLLVGSVAVCRVWSWRRHTWARCEVSPKVLFHTVS